MYKRITSILIILYLTLNLLLIVKCETKNLTRCCPENTIMIPRNKTCVPFEGVFSPLIIYDRGLQKTDKKSEDVFQLQENTSFVLQPNVQNLLISGFTKFNYYLNEDGIIYMENPNAYDRFTIYPPGRFCVADYIPRKGNRNKTLKGFWLYLSLEENNEEQDPNLTISSMYISSIFFILVLVVYAVLPELRNLHGLILMAYVGSMLAAFLALATLQLLGALDLNSVKVCLTFSPMIYFFFLSSFCWMNVMSFDIWWTFRGYAKARPIHRRGEMFKFFTYSVYSWGLPIAMTAGFIVLNSINVEHIPWLIVPKIPEFGCFINGGQRFLYLYVPMLIVLTTNWILFLMTGFNIWRLNRGTAVLNAPGSQAHRSQRQRFGIYMKLSIVMGINWVLEVISAFTPDNTNVIWKITDAYNLLIGFNIFVIFICKRKIFNMLMKRIKGGKRRPPRSWKGSSQRSIRSSSSNSSSCPTDSEDNETTLQISLNPKGHY